MPRDTTTTTQADERQRRSRCKSSRRNITGGVDHRGGGFRRKRQDAFPQRRWTNFRSNRRTARRREEPSDHLFSNSFQRGEHVTRLHATPPLEFAIGAKKDDVVDKIPDTPTTRLMERHADCAEGRLSLWSRHQKSILIGVEGSRPSTSSMAGWVRRTVRKSRRSVRVLR